MTNSSSGAPRSLAHSTITPHTSSVVEVECRPDRASQIVLLIEQQEPNRRQQVRPRDRLDAVAMHDAVMVEVVTGTDQDLRGQAANGGRDRSHSDPAQVRDGDRPRQHQCRTNLVQSHQVNRTH